MALADSVSHARVEKPDEGIEAVLIRADDHSRESIGEEGLPS
jgi:hypothetical protein